MGGREAGGGGKSKGGGGGGGTVEEYGKILSKLSAAKDKLNAQVWKVRDLRKKLGAKADGSAIFQKEIAKSKRLNTQYMKLKVAVDAAEKIVIR